MKNFYKKIILFTLILFFSASCSKIESPTSSQTNTKTNYSQKLKIKNIYLDVEVANNPESWKLGLSHRNSLFESQGMLFIFPNESITNFWMKDMNFNIDIIWINKNKVIGITKNIPAPKNCLKQNIDCDPLPLYAPPSKVDWVLETVSGFSEKNNITVGDDVILEK